MADGADYRALQLRPRRRRAARRDRSIPTSELNTVDGLLHGELTRLFRELKREDAARAVLLTGRGRAFSAGGDFRWFPTLDDLAKLEHLRRDAKQMIWDLLDVELPIVAALNGPAVGLGASIALLCDVIFMARDGHDRRSARARGDRRGRRRHRDLAARARPRAREAVPAHGRSGDGRGGARAWGS